MASKQTRMRTIALVTIGLEAGALFELSVLFGSGKAGTWAFPTFLAFEAIVLIIGLVLLIRTQRAPSRDH